MSHTTKLDRSFKEFEDNVFRRELTAPSGGFNSEEREAEAKKERIERCLADFWEFDRTYFPGDNIKGYAPPGHLHRSIFKTFSIPGIHWHGSYRHLVKTVYGMKILIWMLLRGDINFAAYMMEVLKKSSAALASIDFGIFDNPRIKEDFEPSDRILNDEMFSFKVLTNPRRCIVVAISMQSGLRGGNQQMSRPQLCIFDDIETKKSSFSADAVEAREEILIETYKSLDEDGIMIGFGNNLDPDCLFNRLLIQQEKGVAIEHFTVWPYPDWSDKKTKWVRYVGSVWPEKFPATSKDEMRTMRRIMNEKEWSQAMCKPIKNSGTIFKRELYQEYKEIPHDAVGVAYCDQNLAKKKKGDKTAFAALLYSPSEGKAYIFNPVCRSYSNSNQLLKDYWSLFDPNRIPVLAMDGNVSQESHWRDHLYNYSQMERIPMPPIQFKHYNVDMLSQSASMAFDRKLFLFPPGFAETEEGAVFTDQIFTFQGKKAGNPDDAPDWLVCCYTFLMECGYIQPQESGDPYAVQSYKFKNRY